MSLMINTCIVKQLKVIIDSQTGVYYVSHKLSAIRTPQKVNSGTRFGLSYHLHLFYIPNVDISVKVSKARETHKSGKGVPFDSISVVLAELVKGPAHLVVQYRESGHETRNNDEVVTVRTPGYVVQWSLVTVHLFEFLFGGVEETQVRLSVIGVACLVVEVRGLNQRCLSVRCPADNDLLGLVYWFLVC